LRISIEGFFPATALSASTEDRTFFVFHFNATHRWLCAPPAARGSGSGSLLRAVSSFRRSRDTAIE
jgi:hypothetical protein